MPVTSTTGSLTFNKVVFDNESGWFAQPNQTGYYFRDVCLNISGSNLCVVGNYKPTVGNNIGTVTILNVSNATPTVILSRQTSANLTQQNSFFNVVQNVSETSYNISGNNFGVSGNIFPTGNVFSTYASTFSETVTAPLVSLYGYTPGSTLGPNVAFHSFTSTAPKFVSTSGLFSDGYGGMLWGGAFPTPNPELSANYRLIVVTSKITGNFTGFDSNNWTYLFNNFGTVTPVAANVHIGSVLHSNTANKVFLSSGGIHNSLNNYLLYVTALDTTGNALWNSEIYLNPTIRAVKSVLDNDANIYTIIYDVTNNCSYFIKHNQNGAFLFQRKINEVRLDTISFNTTNQLYLVGKKNVNGLYIARFDTDGNLIWQNTLVSSSYDLGELAVCSVVRKNNLYIAGNFILSLPANGDIPGIGSYGGFLTYSIANNVVEDANLSVTYKSPTVNYPGTRISPASIFARRANVSSAIANTTAITVSTTTIA